MILAYSDPGYMNDDKDAKILLDPKILKSIEEVIIKFNLKRRKKNEEDINYGYEIEMKDQSKNPNLNNDNFYSEKNNNVLKINFDLVSLGGNNDFKRNGFMSSKHTSSKKIDFMDDLGLEDKVINISHLNEQEDKEKKDEVKIIIEDASNRSDSIILTNGNKSVRPQLKINCEESNINNVKKHYD